MKKYLDLLIIEEDPLKRIQDSEIYKSIHISSIVEIMKNRPRAISSKKIGSALRINDKKNNRGALYTSPNITIDSKWIDGAIVNDIPYYGLPNKIITTPAIVPNVTLETPDYFLSRIQEEKRKLQECRLFFEKIAVEEDTVLYSLSNSFGVSGIGYKYFLSINCLLTDEKKRTINYAKVFDWTCRDKAFDISFNAIAHLSVFPSNYLEIKNVPMVLLSCNAVIELFYLLFFFLNDEAIKRNMSPAIQDLLCQRKHISRRLNVIENSSENRIVGGNIDGEGTARSPICIFEKGVLKTLITKYSTNETTNSSGSAYRFDYSTLPQTKASKIYIEPGFLSEEELLLKYDLVGKVETFQGMYESFNKESFCFSAILHIKIIKRGRYIGYTTKKVNLNLIDILSNVTDVSNNVDYSGDGALFAPSMISKIEV